MGPFYKHGFTLTPELISIYVHHKVWDKITFPKLQRLYCWSLGTDTLFRPTLDWTCDYLSMLRLKSNLVSKRVSCGVFGRSIRWRMFNVLVYEIDPWEMAILDWKVTAKFYIFEVLRKCLQEICSGLLRIPFASDICIYRLAIMYICNYWVSNMQYIPEKNGQIFV